MSKKHEQRTRAQILAKRQQPIAEVSVMKKIVDLRAGVATYVPQTTHSERLRAEFGRSKYMPHFGKKQQEKLQKQLQRHALKLAA